MFCKTREKLKLRDECENNFIFKEGQKKHYLEARHVIHFPEQCGYFMRLTIQDRKRVLKDMKWCQKCGTVHSTEKTDYEKVCNRRRAFHVMCNGDGKDPCWYYWPLCYKHTKENDNKSKRLLIRKMINCKSKINKLIKIFNRMN